MKNKEKLSFVESYQKAKDEDLAKEHNTVESMVYDNGATLSFILKELYKMNNSMNQLKLYHEDEK